MAYGLKASSCDPLSCVSINVSVSHFCIVRLAIKVLDENTNQL